MNAYQSKEPWEVTGESETDCGWAGFTFFEVHGSDGDLVALAAGRKHADMIAAMPKMLEALEMCYLDLKDIINAADNGNPYSAEDLAEHFKGIYKAYDAILEAKREHSNAM
jgi:hypothetical protein